MEENDFYSLRESNKMMKLFLRMNSVNVTSNRKIKRDIFDQTNNYCSIDSFQNYHDDEDHKTN